ncbi:hypothetical protein QBC32DRAFT_268594 [Pseudoneurospora amorphoporcata]|uniref:BRCT domain-containing protein n=1 Tax=Pseudoneurospora amorphoporcata TaxID=241081 RepID=A0AAN6SBX3_9PEZI|nr:hypothetical protein QBC32DRAFT_268594 [Pseudoneurospora amorphoporcata]
MSNALRNNSDNDATDSLDTQAVLDDYMKTYGTGKVCRSSPISNQSSSSKSTPAQHPTMSKSRKQRDEDLFPPLTQTEEDRIRNSRPADDLIENKPIDMEAFRTWQAQKAAERKRAREEAQKPKVSWFKPSRLFFVAAQWEAEEKERRKKKKEQEEQEKARREAQDNLLESEEQLRAGEAEKTEEQKQVETQPSLHSNDTTQSNSGRSYEKYVASASQANTRDALRSSPKLGASSPALEPASIATTVPDPRASRLLDTPATNKTTSTTQDESGRVDFGSIARMRSMHSEKPQASPAHQVPETPVSDNNNPFRQGKTQLLGPSQLFGATQFSSAAKAFASPTSSRPSPSDFMHHTASPNLAVSSPLRTRGLRSSPPQNVPSSPAALPNAPPPKPTQRRLASPGPGNLEDDMVIPESPQTKLPKKNKKATQGPFASYEPMDKSQERWSGSIAGSDPAVPPNDEDTETSIVRRRTAKLKKKAALEQLTEIRLPRVAKSDDVEIPSSNRNRRGKTKPATQQPEHGDEEPTIPNTVEEPQGQGVKPAAVHAVDDESTQSGPDEDPSPKPDAVFKIPRPSQRPAPRSLSPVHEKPGDDASGTDGVPKKSPAKNMLEGDPVQEPPSSSRLPALPAPSNCIPSSSPPLFQKRRRKKRVSASADQAARIPTSSTVRTTTARLSSSAVDPVVQTTSDLSNLSSTPVIPSSAVAARDPSTSFTRPHLGSSSPAPVTKLRRDAAPRLPKLPKISSTESLRQSARTQRRPSSSADELSVSGAAIPTFDQSVRMSRSSLLKPIRTSSMTVPAQRGTKIFEGMAFAISFQSKRSGESVEHHNARTETAANIEKRIKQAGGRILDNGFDELFEPVPVQPAASTSNKDKSHASSPSDEPPELLLNNIGRDTGFTALIADGHSRKVKYMQALALGLPILASRWVITCLSSNSIIDWSPYLLAAGQSAFLGDAILSRNLQPYDASTAKLVETVARRGRWLGGSRILLVMSKGGDKKGRRTRKEKEKAEEGRKMAYVFLARVLGAELRRVGSVEEARRELERAEKETEDGKGKPYDWVYVDGKADGAELFTSPAAMIGDSDAGSASASGAGKDKKSRKRKRQNVRYVYEPTEAEKQPPLKKIRTLSDELVIQSLILGRMIDEEELGSM